MLVYDFGERQGRPKGPPLAFSGGEISKLGHFGLVAADLGARAACPRAAETAALPVGPYIVKDEPKMSLRMSDLPFPIGG